MAALPVEVSPLENLGSESDFTGIRVGEEILLTPYLTLACALLYMMAADGNLGEQESSHLQGVLGNDDKVLAYALRYVQTTPIEKFLSDAPELLSSKDKWCILVNVCDALLSDGHVEDEELALFARLTTAFGVSEQAFKPYLKILSLKNDKSVLGRYTGVKQERQAMTPHFALAVSLLYMMTADGSVGAEEIGQLEAAVGEFEGLQSVALKYVRAVKLKPFLAEAAAILKPEQKIYILTNVCDSMMADGSVGRLEDKVFVSMMNGFGISEKSFAVYFKVIETKNIKPFDCTFKNRSMQTLGIASGHGDGPKVQNELAGEAQLNVDAGGLSDAANQGVWAASHDELAMSNFIGKTMKDNIQSVKDDFGTQHDVVQVSLNATDALNLQKLDDESGDANRQKIDGPDGLNNRQKLDGAADLSNRQKLDDQLGSENRQSLGLKSPAANHQTLSDEQLAANRQRIDLDGLGMNRAVIPPEIRMQNIEEVVQVVTQRLDTFEKSNFSFLQIGRTQRYDDSFVLIDESDSTLNRQLINESYERMGVAAISDRIHQSAHVLNATSNAQLHRAESGLRTTQEHAVSVVSDVSNFKTAEQRKSYARRFSQVGQAYALRERSFKVNYVQLLAAFAMLTFAAPISTQPSLSRAAVGLLVVIQSEISAQQVSVHPSEAALPLDLK